MKKEISTGKSFERLIAIMHELRSKCPWDKKQTMESLRYLTIEETYELADAILEKDLPKIKQELGDLLLHIVFYSQIAEEKNAFNAVGVIEDLIKKLIHRHPHIYGDVKAETPKQVKENWEKLKIKEGKKSVMEGVPQSLPAVVKAMRIQEKARAAGFDWENKEQVWEKVLEELSELKKETEAGTERTEEELGDLLFSLVNFARFISVDPEMALEKTNKKFLRRFKYIENSATASGKTLTEMTLKEMDGLWEKAKSKV